MKTKLIFIIFSFALLFISCQNYSNTKTEKTEAKLKNENRSAYFVEAFDSSKVLVIPMPGTDVGYIFYRDKNHDGWADSKGKGFYMLDMSRTIEEYDLAPKKFYMDSLYKKYQR